MLKERHQVFVSVLVGLDGLVVAAAQITTIPAAELLRSTAVDGGFWRSLIPFAVSIPLMLGVMAAVGLYRPRRDRSFLEEFLDIVKAGCFGWGLFIVAMHFARPEFFQRPNATSQLALYPVVLVGFLVLHRYTFRCVLRAFRERGWNLRHVAIIGTGRLGQIAHRTIARNSWTGLNCVYFISHHDTTRRTECQGLRVIGGLDNLEATLEGHPVDGVMIALPQSRAYLLPQILMRLERMPIEVRIVPDVSPKYLPVNMGIYELDGMPVLSLRQSPLNGYGAIAKRALDLVVSLACLVFFAAPMLVIAALVKLQDGGPVLFKQVRVGMGGRPFEIYKFRTMRVESGRTDAEARGAEAWTRRDDPRVTTVGRWLRRTSLDELPQLFNVLKGDMSLVGPRPERLDLLNDFRNDWRGYMLRQNIKAGMTGWAQVNGLRGETSLRKRLQYDLYYVRNWSLLFDLRILWLTLFRGFRHPNAY